MIYRITFRDGNPDQKFDTDKVEIDYFKRAVFVNRGSTNFVSAIPLIYPFENISRISLESEDDSARLKDELQSQKEKEELIEEKSEDSLMSWAEGETDVFVPDPLNNPACYGCGISHTGRMERCGKCTFWEDYWTGQGYIVKDGEIVGKKEVSSFQCPFCMQVFDLDKIHDHLKECKYRKESEE